jgi:hypothetical protein
MATTESVASGEFGVIDHHLDGTEPEVESGITAGKLCTVYTDAILRALISILCR